jgi:Cu/Ag efflux pump CusA
VSFGSELVARGSRAAMGPIVTAALTTAIVLMPALVFGDIAGEEILRPMAVVMLGGLVTSSLVSLFILPALYLRFGPRQEAAPLQLETMLDLTDRPVAKTAPASS